MIDSVMERAKRAESAEEAMPVNRGELSYAVCGTKRRFVLVKVFRLGGKKYVVNPRFRHLAENKNKKTRAPPE
jgi:hypothetical protein